MADPTAYSVGYSFSGYQALNPALPLPALPLDTEFDRIEIAVDSVITALAEVRRSDGNLQNGTVTYDVLSDDVKELIAGSAQGVNIGSISVAAFATPAEAEAGVAADKLMTPLSTAQAITAQRAFATQAQAEAGTNNTTVLTPLRGAQMLGALRGFATQGEAEAGTNETKVLSPLGGKQAIDAQRAALTATSDLTWGAITALSSADQTITVTGAAANDRVVLGLPDALAAGLIPVAWVSAADTVKIRLFNATGGTLTPHSGSATPYSVTVLQF